MDQKETSHIMMNCEVGSEDSIIDELKSIDYVKEVQGVLGNYDILAKIETPSIEHTRDTIAIIRKIKNIHCTTTIICAKNLDSTRQNESLPDMPAVTAIFSWMIPENAKIRIIIY